MKVTLPAFGLELAEFIGICLGDGCVTKYQVSVSLNTNADKDYIPYVIALMKKLFPEAHISLVRKADNATDVKLNSVIVSQFLHDMGIVPNHKRIPSWIFSSSMYKQACVRGLFDTEGSISLKIYNGKKGRRFYKQLNFRNTDRNLMKLVRDTIFEIGLKPTMTLKKSLYVSNQRAIDIYRNTIGFSNPKLEEKSTTLQHEAHSK